MKRIVALILVMIMTVALFACGNDTTPSVEPSGTENTPTQPSGTENTPPPVTPEPEKPAEPKIYRSSMSGTPANAWAPMSNTAASASLQGYLSGTLYATLPVDGKGAIAPLLAAGEPVDVNGDGKTWNITISENAKWENGDAITADTFMYSFKTILDPKLVLPNASGLAKNIVNVVNASKYYTQVSDGTTVAWEDVGFKKVDDMTIQVTVKSACTPQHIMRHFATTTSAPVYQPLFESCLSSDGTTTTYGSAQDKIISSGVFKIKTWADGSVYEFEKNEHFCRNDLVKLDGVTISVIEDGGTELQLFEQGELDYITLDDAGRAKFGDDPRVATVPGRRVYSIEYNSANTEKPIINSENFRLALLYATNRVELGKLTNLPPATGLLSPTSTAKPDGTTFRELAAQAGYEPANNGYDPELAKQYFDKALQDVGESSVELTLLCNNGDRLTTIAEYLQETWTALFGADKFTLKIDAQPSAQAGELRKGWKDNPNSYEITLTQWNLSGGDYDPITALRAYTTSYSARYAPYEYETLNTLYEEAGNYMLDQDKRNELAMEMEKYILEHGIVTPLAYETTSCIYSDRMVPPVDSYVTGLGWGWRYADIAQ